MSPGAVGRSAGRSGGAVGRSVFGAQQNRIQPIENKGRGAIAPCAPGYRGVVRNSSMISKAGRKGRSAPLKGGGELRPSPPLGRTKSRQRRLTVKPARRVPKSTKSPPKVVAKRKTKPKPKERKTMTTFRKTAELLRGGDKTTERRGGDEHNAAREGDSVVDIGKLEAAIGDVPPWVPTTEALQAALVLLVDAVMAARVPPPEVAARSSRSGRASAEQTKTSAEMVDLLIWNEPADYAIRRQLYLERIAATPVETALRAGIRLIGEELHKRGGLTLMNDTVLAIYNEDTARRAVMDLTWEGVGGEWYVTKAYDIPPPAA